MTSEYNIPLPSIKQQVEKMFEVIHSLGNNDKNEAFEYLRTYLKDDVISSTNNQPNIVKYHRENNKPPTNHQSKIETLASENCTKENKETNNRRCPKSNYRKMKFKNHSRSVKRAVLKCRICGALNKTKTLLLKHLESHVGTPISCGHCKQSFNNRTSFLCHISLKMCRKNVFVKKYSCDQCPKVFRNKRHIERHTEGHKRNNCTYCDARLTRRKQLVDHLLNEHSIKLERAIMFKCEYCEKRYVKKRSLYHHLKQHAEDKVVCMECGKMSSTEEEHMKHFSEHDKDRPWKCDKCNDRFSRRQQYLIHLKRHDRYNCITCNETFSSKLRVKRHKQRGHIVQGLEPQMHCPHCPMAFQTKLSLQIHMRKHPDEKQMHCKYCDKSFRSNYLYFKHCATTVHEIHSPEKQQLVCEICGKLFVKKFQLEQHLHRVHNPPKQTYNCEYCGHKTSSRKNMERHLALHLEDKKGFICEQCGKAFYNINHLKDHIGYVHKETRDWKCEECGKAFKRSSELTRHQTSHSKLRPHVCKICGVGYKRLTHLRRHEESRHGTTSKNRMVQRLKKDENGVLVPVPTKKPAKPETKPVENTPVSNSEQVFSIMDAQSGEMVTFTMPHITEDCSTLATVYSVNNHTFSQDILQAVELPYQDSNLVLNTDNILLNDISSQALNLADGDHTFAHYLNSDFQNADISNSFRATSGNILQNPMQIQNSTTCDILLPENRLLDLHNQHKDYAPNYSHNPYHFL